MTATVRTDSHANDLASQPSHMNQIQHESEPSNQNPGTVDGRLSHLKNPGNNSRDETDPLYPDLEGNSAKDYSFENAHNFDSSDYVLGQNTMDYGRGFGFGGDMDGWSSVTMVDGDLEPLEEEVPYFEQDSPTHVTASVGAPAHIPCMVRNLGSKSVSTQYVAVMHSERDQYVCQL